MTTPANRIALTTLLGLLVSGCTTSTLRFGDAATPSGEPPVSEQTQQFDFSQMAVEKLVVHADQTYREKAYRESEAAYQEIVKRVPGNAGAWLRLGNIYGRTARPNEAVDAYREAVIRKPSMARAWHNMGVIQLNQAANSFQQLLLHAEADEPMAAVGERTRNGILQLMGSNPPSASRSATSTALPGSAQAPKQ